MDMPNLQMNVQNDYHLYLLKLVNINFDVQYNIYFHVSELSFSKSTPSSSDPSEELVGVCEVLSSSSVPTNALQSNLTMVMNCASGLSLEPHLGSCLLVSLQSNDRG